MRWLKRTDLAKLSRNAPAGSLLFAGEPAEGSVPLPAADVTAMQALSRAAFAKAGLADSDRVLFAIRQSGSPSVELLAQAAATLVSGVAMTGPQGRLRLLSTIRAVKPSVLVTTPCGAVDFLARLYLEFNVDPIELNLPRIVLVGEIASPGVTKRIAKEFESEVAEIYCDPIFGAALACRRGGDWGTVTDGVLATAAIGHDEIATESIAHAAGELILRPTWSAALSDVAIRTGQIAADAKSDRGLFDHTVGDHVLIRGQWVSLPLLRKNLGLIDGISAWTLIVDRGDRTLDNATLKVAFERETLVTNPMWKGRIQQALTAVTPVHIDVATELFAADGPADKETILDQRGHHLGVDRQKVAAP